MVSHFGHVTIEQLIEVLGDHKTPNHALADHAWLVDLSGFQTTDICFVDLMRVVPLQEARQKPLRRVRQIALFAPTDLGFGMARMYEQLCNTSEFFDARVFSRLDDALAWLDRPGITPKMERLVAESCYIPNAQMISHSAEVTG
ncbi:MAG: STAS/SEC14 domain-containing protein [Pelagimonas sp.]|jgi:hypothetical protein|nr:STAS/SEC14 domain-containing protein [Pelagimonas sp.]